MCRYTLSVKSISGDQNERIRKPVCRDLMWCGKTRTLLTILGRGSPNNVLQKHKIFNIDRTRLSYWTKNTLLPSQQKGRVWAIFVWELYQLNLINSFVFYRTRTQKVNVSCANFFSSENKVFSCKICTKV